MNEYIYLVGVVTISLSTIACLSIAAYCVMNSLWTRIKDANAMCELQAALRKYRRKKK